MYVPGNELEYEYVSAFVKRGLVRTIINIKKCNFEIFNSIYLENDLCCLLMFLYQSIASYSR